MNRQRPKKHAAELLKRPQRIPVDQAKTDVTRYEAEYRKSLDSAKAKATVVAQATARVVSAGALLAFFALMMGAAAAWLGGAAGGRATNRLVPLDPLNEYYGVC